MNRGRQDARRSEVFPETAPATLAYGAWLLDPRRSFVSFAVPYWWGLGTVKGRFTTYVGRLELGARPAIELTIDAASVDTGNARRDDRLRAAEFFAVARTPTIRFVSRTVTLDGDRLSVVGDLLARGARTEVEIDAAVNAIDGEYAFDAETFVMHSGLGMTWNPVGITRPWCKLSVGGRLVQVPAKASPPRGSGAGRCYARSRNGPIPYWAWPCQR